MAPANLPPTCWIVDWTVFAPGLHKGSLYTPADCDRVPPNFARLRGHIDPVVKLGHDRDQGLIERAKKSLGFLNLGDFYAVTPKPFSRFAVTLHNVPTLIGGLVNARRIKSGSVELIPFCQDPADPSKRIQGPIITGLSFLGDEHPAVKGLSSPRAVFADGTPVPPNHDIQPWLELMAAEHAERMASGFSAEYDPRPRVYRTRDGHEYPVHTISFSEMTPMGGLTPELLKSFGLTPEQIDQIMAAAGGGAPPAGAPGDMPPPPPPAGGAGSPPPGLPPIGAGGDGPPEPPGKKPGDMAQDDQTMMSAKAFAAVVQRLGALEAQRSDAAKEACMSAAVDRVELVLKANAKRIPPAKRAGFKQLGVNALTQKNFADVAGDAEKAFAAWREYVELLPESNKFSAEIGDGKPKNTIDNLTPTGRRAIAALKDVAPSVHKRLTEAK